DGPRLSAGRAGSRVRNRPGRLQRGGRGHRDDHLRQWPDSGDRRASTPGRVTRDRVTKDRVTGTAEVQATDTLRAAPSWYRPGAGTATRLGTRRRSTRRLAV